MNLTGGMKEVHGNLSFLNTIDYIIHLVAAGNITSHYIDSNATELTVYPYPPTHPLPHPHPQAHRPTHPPELLLVHHR